MSADFFVASFLKIGCGGLSNIERVPRYILLVCLNIKIGRVYFDRRFIFSYIH